MPIYEVQTDAGKFQIEAADETALAAAVNELPQAAETTLAGVGKAAWSGLREGAAGLAGLPADAINLVGQMTGRGDQTAQFAKDYGSEAMRGRIEGATGEMYKPQTGIESLARNVGSFAPMLVGGGTGLAARVATRVAAPAVGAELGRQATEGTAYAPYGEIGGAVVGAVLGGGIPRMLSRATSPATINPERAAALRTLQAEGVQVPASMATGSKVLKAAESEIGGSKFDDIVRRMNEQYTGAAINRLSPMAGVKGEKLLTPEVLTRAESNIGDVFNKVAARNPRIDIAPKDYAALRSVADDFEALTGARSPLIDRFVKQIGNTGQKPAISGQSYQTLQSDIARYARAAQQPELKFALQDLRSALDKAIEGGLKNVDDLSQWRQARKDWHNTMLLSRAVGGSTEAAANGMITPAKLQQAIESMKRGNYARGKGDFSELARAGNQIMKPFQDSGTPSRLRAMAVPAAVGAVVGGGLGALPGAAFGIIAPNLAGRALMSAPVQRYLQRQPIGGGGLLGGGGLPSPAQGSLYAALMAQRPQPVQ